MSAAWAGGEDGNVVTRKFLEVAKKKLVEGGVIYLLLIGDNLGLVKEFESVYGLKHELLMSRNVPGENQFVFKLTKL